MIWMMLAVTAVDPGPVFAAYDRAGAPSVSVLVRHDGQKIFEHSYGLADVEAKRAATPRTNYRLASVSKQFTATAVLTLVQEKRLRLDDPIDIYLPGLPSGINVKHLLTHQSGLADYEDHLPPGDFQVKDADVLSILQKVPTLLTPPGAKYAYSNSGYSLLALLVEKITGQRYADALDARVLKPAGMKNSVAHEEGRDTVKDRAYGYSIKDEQPRRTDQSRTSAVLGDGGLYSSLEDLNRWLDCLRRHCVLSQATQQMAFTPAPLKDGTPTEYGFGWFIRPPLRWHTGETVGFRNAIVVQDGYEVVILSNRTDTKARDLAQQVLKLYLPKP
jgi:CubicO group peptidase (beta-lactamase class C family)